MQLARHWRILTSTGASDTNIQNMSRMKLIMMLVLISCVSGCSSSKKNAAATLREQEKIRLPDSLKQLQQKGIDFIATGSNPVSWKVSVDLDKGVDFTAFNGFSLSVPLVKRDSTKAGNTGYISVSPAGKIQVIIYEEPCEMQEGIIGKKVEVTVNNTRYTGCGKYLYNSNIHDHWVLETISNKLQEASAYPRGLPYIVLDMNYGKVSGSGGCNRLSGTFEIIGNRISFGPFTSTKMACSNNLAEKIFNTLLSGNLVDYFIKNEKLVLYLKDDSTLTFTKK